MSEAKHTPGPWEIETDFCDCGGDYPCAHGEYPVSVNSTETIKYGLGNKLVRPKVITSFSESDYFEETGEANARLIAQAPNLLDACKQLLAAMDSITTSISAGESTYAGPVKNPTMSCRIARAAIAKATAIEESDGTR